MSYYFKKAKISFLLKKIHFIPKLKEYKEWHNVS